jgi:hypothetical protein
MRNFGLNSNDLLVLAAWRYEMKVQKPDDFLELGTWIGRKQAFASLAGGCSAADAECLRKMRDHRQYRALGLTWEEFCSQRIGITRQWADKLIRRLEEFGPQYFRLAQATGITPEEYRRIAGSIGEKGLAHAGELIPITAEDAPRLIAAVEELRRQAEPAGEKRKDEDLDRAVEKAERLLRAAVDEITRVEDLSLGGPRRERLFAKLAAQLRRLRMLQEVSVRFV